MSDLIYEIHEMSGFGQVSKEKYIRGAKKLMIAINSEEFKQRVLNYSYEDRGQKINNFKSPETEGKSMNRREIYEYIMSGRDKFNKEADKDIDIKISLYHKRWSSAIGYTYPNTWKTWINFKFFKNFSDADVAGNIIHEYMHNLGFDHDFNWNSTRKHTVPYAIGTIIREIAEKIKDGQLDDSEDIPVEGKDTPVEVGHKVVCKRLWYTLWIVKTCWKEKK